MGQLRALFTKALGEQQFSGTPKELYEPFEYILSMGGKRMRPVLLLHACEMFGEDASKALNQALAIELFHNFTLIHDDIMDRAPLRRGLPTVHDKFNSSTAILCGDAMMVFAYRYLVKTDTNLLPSLLEIFNNCAVMVCEGQQMDMNYEKMDGLNVEDYLKMIELKTATLLATSMKIGAITGGASEEDANHLYNFGKFLGISFQLKDDWLDSFGDAEKVGKLHGGDIIQNKKTFLLLEAFHIADEQSRHELNACFSDSAIDANVKVKKVLEIFSRLRIDQITLTEIEKYFNTALNYLDAVSLPPERKEILRQLANELLHRQV